MLQVHDVLLKIAWNRREPPPEPRRISRSPKEFCNLKWLRRHGTVWNGGYPDDREISTSVAHVVQDLASLNKRPCAGGEGVRCILKPCLASLAPP